MQFILAELCGQLKWHYPRSCLLNKMNTVLH